MVKYNLIATEDSIGIKVIGHASEYPEHDGKNIVCAAVSTICDMAATGCAFYTDANIKADKGYHFIKCEKTPETVAIIVAAVLELQLIKKNYPYCFERDEKIETANSCNE